MKNLGWLLLLLFFVFMLFIISSSNNQAKTGTGIVSSASGEVVEDIDAKLNKLVESADLKEELVSSEASLEKKEKKGFFSFLGFGKNKKNTQKDEDIDSIESDELETAEDTAKEENETDDEDAEENRGSGELDDDDQQGFFSKLFKGDNSDEESKIEEIKESEVVSVEKEEKNIVNIRDTLIGVGNGPDYSGRNIAKRTTGNKRTAYSDGISKLPGVDLETYVGKKYEIGVQALKLNNKSFSQTLGYMSRGDVVTQISKANSYGCFEVTVESSNQDGYVCKKYLRDTVVQEESNTNDVVAEPTIKESYVEEIHTSIGSYYRVSGMSDNTELTQGDILRQTSTPRTGLCTQMKIVGSNLEENTGKIVDICSMEGITPMK